MASNQSSPRPPALLWGVAATVASLRALPYLWSHWAQPPSDSVLLRLGYIPKDFLQYQAFMRQAAEEGRWLLADPFTTEPQSPRFIAPFFALLGRLAGAIDAAPMHVLEAARIPLVFAFFAVLWWFLAPFFSDVRERGFACVLVGLAGGIEVIAKPLGALLPAAERLQLEQSTWQMSGWNHFAAAYNPLWIAAAIGLLFALRPIFAERGRLAPRALAQISGGAFVLYWIHPYSAFALLGILVAQPLVAWAAGSAESSRRWGGIALALAPSLALIGAVALWQRADPVYAAAAQSALGPQQLTPFWYPLVLGGLCVLGLRGARQWVQGSHPLRFALLGWGVAAVALHTSNLFNGYHFASQLHLPLCILATPALADTWAAARAGRASARALLAACFAAPLLLTAESLAELPSTHAVPTEFPALFEHLEGLEPGNTLTPPKLGNALPAYTSHRVYVGHHFLTPDFRERSDEVRELSTRASGGDALRELVHRENIRYVVLPTDAAAPGLAALAPLARERRSFGRFTLLELR